MNKYLCELDSFGFLVAVLCCVVGFELGCFIFLTIYLAEKTLKIELSGYIRYHTQEVLQSDLFFNVHIQSKLLSHMPVMGTHSSYQLGCLSRTDG